jgi:hypothetical protein
MPIKNPESLFAQVVEDLGGYVLDNVNEFIDYDSGTMTLVTRDYRFKIVINQNDIEYNFDLNKDLSGGVYLGSGACTHSLVKGYDPAWTDEAFEEVRLFLRSLLSNELYYGVFGGNAVLAEPNKDGTYDVTFVPTKRQNFVTIDQETWSKSKVMKETRLTRLYAINQKVKESKRRKSSKQKSITKNSEINPENLFAQVAKDVKLHSISNINVNIDYDAGTIILVTKDYELKIDINDERIGYDFSLDRGLTRGRAHKSSIGIDLHVPDYNPKQAKEIFGELRHFVNSLLSDNLYYDDYTYNGRAVLAVPNEDGTYNVTFSPLRMRSLRRVKKETWSKDEVTDDSSGLTRLDSSGTVAPKSQDSFETEYINPKLDSSHISIDLDGDVNLDDKLMQLVNKVKSIREWNRDEFEALETITSSIMIDDEFDYLPSRIYDEIDLIDSWEMEELKPNDVMESVKIIEDYVQEREQQDVKSPGSEENEQNEILDASHRVKILHIDHDQEDFEFYNKHLTDNEYLDQWRKSLIRLHKSNVPVLLPTYLEYGKNEINLLGYTIYPYESAWVLIDRGVRMPKDIDIADSYKYLDPLGKMLPKNAKTWQSHWWLTGEDLSQLANDIGEQLVFEKGTIPTWPLSCSRDKSIINIYADKRHFVIDFSTFKNSADVEWFAREQVANYIRGKSDIAIIPGSVSEGDMLMYTLFKGDQCEYIAQSYSYVPCNGGDTVDFNAIELLVKRHNEQPYVIRRRPLVYTLHARYSSGTTENLLGALTESTFNSYTETMLKDFYKKN